MTSSKGGRPVKGQGIVDGFNQKKNGSLSEMELNKAKIEARLLKEREKFEKRQTEKELAKLQADIERAKQDAGIKTVAPVVEEKVETADADDEKSAIRMLQDLRYAYRNAMGPSGKRGKRRLVELMEDDKDFKFVVKELLKIEASLLAARIRKEGGDGEGGGRANQNFFVVLKGLEQEKALLTSDGGAIDVAQVERALSPDQGPLEMEDEDTGREKPTDIFKPLEGVG